MVRRRAAVTALAVPVAVEETEPENEYERQRDERIKRNREMLAQLDIQANIDNLHILNDQQKAVRRVKRKSKPAPAADPQPTRKSRRRAAADEENEAARAAAGDADDGQDSASGLLTQQEFLQQQGLELPADHIKSEGFKGWLCEEVCSELHIPPTEEELVQQLAQPDTRRALQRLPDELQAAMRAKGWSRVQASSAAQMRSNPNAYFYRHVAPGQTQAQGEWTPEEHALFLATARQHGVGDAWGLFASYIPRRVGYQCSAYYRDVVIPSGEVLDGRFRINGLGKAVFVGA